MIEWLLNLLFRRYDIRNPEGGQKVLYLRRWFLWRSKRGNLYLHKILRSDSDRGAHDHPWAFTTFCLKGGYHDFVYSFDYSEPESMMISDPQGALVPASPCRQGKRHGPVNLPVRPWRLYRRKATHIHRVILNVRPGANGGPSEPIPAWTLVWTSGKEKPWYFFSKTERIFWRDYLGDWNFNKEIE